MHNKNSLIPRLPKTGLSIAFLVSTLIAADWPMWRFDASRSARSPEKLPAALHLQWVREYAPPEPAWDRQKEQSTYGHPGRRTPQKLAFDIAYQPIAMGNTLVFGSPNNDQLTALDIGTGARKWRFFAGGPIRFAPVAHDSTVFFGSDDGYIYCLRLRDGSVIWKKNLAPNNRRALGNDRVISVWPVRGAPVLSGDTLFAAAGLYPFEGAFVHALNARNGSEIWVNSGDGMLFSSTPHGKAEAYGGIAPQGYLCIARNNKLLIPNGRALPACFSRADGTLDYFRQGKMPKGAGGYHVAAFGDTFFCRDYGFSLANGDRGSKAGPQFDEDNLQIIAGDRIYRSARTLFDTDTSADAPGYTVTTDDLSWSTEVAGRPAGLIAAQGHLVVTTTNGKIFCYGSAKVSAPPMAIRNTPESTKVSGRVKRRAKAILASYKNGSRGVCVVAGLRDGHLIEELVRRSDLTVVGFDNDAAKCKKIREYLDRKELYGKKAHVIYDSFVNSGLPPYIAHLIVSENNKRVHKNDSAFVSEVFRVLRPYGGTALLNIPDPLVTRTLNEIPASHRSITKGKLVRVGPLPGSDNWVSQHNGAQKTTFGTDSLVKMPMGLTWFGGSGDNTNDSILPRHGHGQSPLVIDGRYYQQGPGLLRCVDTYTGRVLWQKRFPLLAQFSNHTHHEAGHIGLGDNVFLTSDAVYVLADFAGVNTWPRACYVLDPATGAEKGRFGLPEGDGFGFISVLDSFLIAGASPITFDSTDEDGYVPGYDTTGKAVYPRSERGENFPVGPGGAFTLNGSASNKLVILHRHTGKPLWTHKFERGLLHHALCAGDGKFFAVDRLPTDLHQSLTRRMSANDKPSSGADPTYTRDADLICFDATTGAVIWKKSNQVDTVFGTYLAYHREHKLLVECQRGSRDYYETPGSSKHIAVRDAETGDVRWRKIDSPYPGGPIILKSDLIITQSATEFKVINLHSGEPHQTKNPLTGDTMPAVAFRTYGCGTGIGSVNLLTFRSGNAGFTDANTFAGTGNWGGFKSGCSSNLIPANGIVTAPEYTRTCGCSYPLQTSVAFAHMPDAEVWTSNPELAKRHRSKGGVLRHAGINFGATGDRIDDRGILWMEYPYCETMATLVDTAGKPFGGYDFSKYPIPISLEIDGENIRYYRHHATTIRGTDLPWVAASGVQGARSVRLGLVYPADTGIESAGADTLLKYTVALSFAEVEQVAAGERVFDIEINGTKVVSDFDIVREAGGTGIAVLKEFKNITASQSLTVTLLPKKGTPILSGIGVRMEEN